MADDTPSHTDGSVLWFEDDMGRGLGHEVVDLATLRTDLSRNIVQYNGRLFTYDGENRNLGGHIFRLAHLRNLDLGDA